MALICSRAKLKKWPEGYEGDVDPSDEEESDEEPEK